VAGKGVRQNGCLRRSIPTIRNRTWPVFLIGLGCLLLLIFLPGLAALRQSAEIYDDVREIQRSHETLQSALFDVERRVLQMSLSVRDFLLDNSPETAPFYRQRFEYFRSAIDDRLNLLSRAAPRQQEDMFDRLRDQIHAYASTMRPVFDWTPMEREAKGTYFLREQQRPRRQSILAIAEEVGRLIQQNYRTRYDEINASQRMFRQHLNLAIGVAFLLGAAVSLATGFRISVLESHFERQRMATEQAERELRSLSARLMQAQEDERRMLSRELHDEVGQLLTALRIELGSLDRLKNASGDEFAIHSSQAKTIAEQTLRTVRDMAVGLRPSVLDLGLEAALRWQARQFSRSTGTEASVSVDGTLPALSETYLTCIYRIVQEALTNSAKHSAAKTVDIKVTASATELNISVRDDGIGLQSNWSAHRGLGLVGIEERARELNGAVTIQSEKGQGVGIDVRLPLPQGESA
jgi:signal transduction histidine kinase